MAKMSLSEIDQKIEELQKLREEAEKAEQEQRLRDQVIEAREILTRLINDLWRLHELDHVPPRLQEALSGKDGKFNPGLYIKRPRAPKDK